MVQDGPTEFESRLAFRTKVPAERLHEFLSWPIYKLRRESEHVSRVLKRIAEAVVNSMENPASTNAFLRDLDLKSISRDHDWRAIFSTIRAHESGYGGYKRIFGADPLPAVSELPQTPAGVHLYPQAGLRRCGLSLRRAHRVSEPAAHACAGPRLRSRRQSPERGWAAPLHRRFSPHAHGRGVGDPRVQG